MRPAIEPFALELYRRYLEGESIEQLASALGIPADRVVWRIRAASLYWERQSTQVGLAALRAQLITS